MFDLLRFREIRRLVVVAAHPDDEVIGAGGMLAHFEEVFVIHTTDGSPRDVSDALRSGFKTGAEYAAARRLELSRALGLAGVPERNAICLGFTDQETMRHLPQLCRALGEALARLEPDAVLTHPYEGGHPDHDSTAFAVDRCWRDRERLFEMTLYHAGDGGSLAAGCFLPNGGAEIVWELPPEDRARKERMLQCFQSQAAVLQQFPVLPEERFRAAPVYDFTCPPHAGTLYYERMPWGITGEEWRRFAAQCQ